MATRKRSAKPKVMTKAQLAGELAGRTGLEKKQAADVLDALGEITGAQLRETGVAAPLPGLLKLAVQRKAATAARQGRNPFTGQPMTIKAKPAHNVVRCRPMKKLKDIAAPS